MTSLHPAPPAHLKQVAFLVVYDHSEMPPDHIHAKDAGVAFKKSAGIFEGCPVSMILELCAAGLGVPPDGEGWKFSIEPVKGSVRQGTPLNPTLGKPVEGGRQFIVLFRDGRLLQAREKSIADVFALARKVPQTPRDIVLLLDLDSRGYPADYFAKGLFVVRIVPPTRATFRAFAPGEAVALRDCPPGPFLHDGRLGLKAVNGRAFDVETGQPIRKPALPVKAARWEKRGDY